MSKDKEPKTPNETERARVVEYLCDLCGIEAREGNEEVLDNFLKDLFERWNEDV